MTAHGLLACSLAVFAVAGTGCAGAIAPELSAPSTVPGVSWRIRTGSLDTGGREVCASDGQQRCILEVSTPDDPQLGTVSVFLLPGDARTTFSGALLVGFVDSVSGRGYESTLRDYTVNPGEPPPLVSSGGRVTAIPGDYQVRIALLASRPERPEPYQVSTTIPVRVEPR